MLQIFLFQEQWKNNYCTYAAISKWLKEGIVEKILVISPTAAFVPWEEEFEGCFGRKPVRSKRLRGEYC